MQAQNGLALKASVIVDFVLNLSVSDFAKLAICSASTRLGDLGTVGSATIL